jgi:hypothetical protein
VIYFNGGVIYVKDNDNAKKIFKIWNEYWRKGNLIGINVDQPSFMVANMLNNNVISELPDIWNCQIYCGLKYLLKSKIIHYFTSQTSCDEEYLSAFTSKDLYVEIKMQGYIDKKIDQILKDPYNYFGERIYIIYGRDVTIWNSFSMRFIRFLYRNCNKLFNVIEFFSRCSFRLKK